MFLFFLIIFFFFFFFFNDTATTEIYTLSLHDALPIFRRGTFDPVDPVLGYYQRFIHLGMASEDRKSTRLNSSHLVISYAVFCLKKKKKTHNVYIPETDKSHYYIQN